MPSTHKTPFLGLNQWLGSDKPKREDFNRDNLALDNGIKTHIEDQQIHITAKEREAWSKTAFQAGSYQGDGAETRTITLGYQPSLVILFAAALPPAEYVSLGDTNYSYLAFATPLGCSSGLAITSTGFTAQQDLSAGGATSASFNLSGYTYIYLALH